MKQLKWVISFWMLVGVYFAFVGTVSADTPPLPPNFSNPDIPEDNAARRAWYARLNDYALVYAEPSRSATVVRNVGDGFLYSSLHATREVNGEKWYMINPGEFVLAEDLKVATASEFHGVLVENSPEHPFGWMVSDQVRPSTESGVEPDQTYDKLDRYHFFEVLDAKEDEEGWIWYEISPDTWMKQTHVSLVDTTEPPAEIPAGAKWVEVDLYEQTFAAYEGEQIVYAGLISSGLNQWPTREGVFEVWDRWERVKMSGAENQVDYYFVEDVPYTMYFDESRGIALHGAYWHDRFGFKHSHGCVNMPILDAQWVYNWTAGDEESGEAEPLFVYVHTSDPGTVFDRLRNAKLAAPDPEPQPAPTTPRAYPHASGIQPY